MKDLNIIIGEIDNRIKSGEYDNLSSMRDRLIKIRGKILHKNELNKFDLKTLEKLKNFIKKGIKLKPIVINYKNEIIDGIHRVYAYQSEKVDSIKAWKQIKIWFPSEWYKDLI